MRQPLRSHSVEDQAMQFDELVIRRRRSANPKVPNPIIIIIQDDGSGTLATA